MAGKDEQDAESNEGEQRPCRREEAGGRGPSGRTPPVPDPRPEQAAPGNTGGERAPEPERPGCSREHSAAPRPAPTRRPSLPRRLLCEPAFRFTVNSRVGSDRRPDDDVAATAWRSTATPPPGDPFQPPVGGPGPYPGPQPQQPPWPQQSQQPWSAAPPPQKRVMVGNGHSAQWRCSPSSA